MKAKISLDTEKYGCYTFLMRITKCDICKKTMTDKNKSGSLEIFYNEKQNYGSFELCNVCSQSIVAILKDKKMIKIKDKKDEK